ncbi:hypothetical protein CROQUDRAFT_95829 [Cronartium quercuum f. sp. fusiforme G11]|uniref:CBF1-interacting co-repressor CIR N-terminal domain-containing protein n=1 Tax=Cronartium quercuum f. sp. fusiforme G11 TaxID=708437 RepID=A0A9P6T9N6_9BASI|nr:hypothetical protein CROQUDRAFT_95829 [Cronartium quercuum f. sp. fusiforme G11]
MGGGDLNMKKSWHPLLMKNQERVWKEERKAVEERKKTAQLQKELAEERQLQELQRLQAAQGGGRREERVDWLYATPAAGTGMNLEDQEAYLLGKKTVDKLFKEKDEAAAKMAARASQADKDRPGGGFISLQNANTARDTASKIREDPLLAIKQQEQMAYEALMKNPARLKAMQAGELSKEARKLEKEERKRAKQEKRDRKRDRKIIDNEHYDRDADGKRSRHEREFGRSERTEVKDHHHRTRRSSSDRRYVDDRHRSPVRERQRSSQDHRRRRASASPPSHASERYRDRSSRHDSKTPPRRRNFDDDASPAFSPRGDKPNGFERLSPHRRIQRSSSPGRSRREMPPPPPQHRNHNQSHDRALNRQSQTGPSSSSNKLTEARAAKLAQMQAAAKAIHDSRSERLVQLEAEDAERLRFEEAEREQNRIKSGGIGDGTRAKFVREQEKKVFFGEMGLGERVKRSGGVGMVKDAE